MLFPLAYHVMLLTFAFLVLPQPFKEIALVGVGLVGVHVLWASLLGGQPLKAFVALLVAPFYIVWKVTTLAAVLAASRRDASWVRTGRNSQV
jgi:hypothetical protein